ncbi:hypothetical protein BGZ94_009162 [Podila epigama]|nr:hypothetical protein BGZ94_009162 [Podila epigama]
MKQLSPLRSLFSPISPHRVCTACSLKYNNIKCIEARSLHATATRLTNSNDNNTPKDIQLQIRQAAARARVPNYAGWWTEILNNPRPPQPLPDPTILLDPEHVFQGTPATTPKETLNNTLPEPTPANTLPTRESLPSAKTSTNEKGGNRPVNDYIDYHGFKVPRKPTPPGAEDCCMSGCAYCIYDIYEEDRQAYKESLAKVLEDIQKAGLPPPPSDIVPNAGGGGSTAGNSNNDDDDMDPGMKAFFELERKLKGG